MTKEVYERVDLEIIQFQTDDVITTSIPYPTRRTRLRVHANKTHREACKRIRCH